MPSIGREHVEKGDSSEPRHATDRLCHLNSAENKSVLGPCLDYTPHKEQQSFFAPMKGVLFLLQISAGKSVGPSFLQQKLLYRQLSFCYFTLGLSNCFSRQHSGAQQLSKCSPVLEAIS